MEVKKEKSRLKRGKSGNNLAVKKFLKNFPFFCFKRLTLLYEFDIMYRLCKNVRMG